jgi:hypothetical protein
MIVPGGGIALDGSRWIASRPAFLLPVRVLGKLFCRLFLTRLAALHDAGRLGFFGGIAHLADRRAFLRHLAPVRKKRWVVYAKAPFSGPEAVLAYLSRYTHQVAISNRRIIGFDRTGVTFYYKDYRRGGVDRQQVMTLSADEFTRRILLYVLPRGFHRIRHYGLLAGATRNAHLERARQLLGASPAVADAPRTRRLPPAVPMLRREDGRHRDVRTLVPPPRPAARTCLDREHHAMIRHGPIPPRHAVHALPAKMPLAPATPRTAVMLISRCDPGRNAHPMPHPVVTSMSAGAPPGGLCARPTIARKAKSP